MSKHYIRKDGSNTIIKAFDDHFEKPEAGDIVILDNAPRHYNPILVDENGRYKLKYEGGKIKNRTGAEMYPETKSVFDTDKSKKNNSVNSDMKEIINLLVSKGTIATTDLPSSLKTRYDNSKS